jgi:hypothetical protein
MGRVSAGRVGYAYHEDQQRGALVKIKQKAN